MRQLNCFNIKKGYYINKTGDIFSSLIGKNKLLKTYQDKNGYLTISLICNDNSRKSFRVHRLVASVFLENPNNLPIVMHKDNNVKNNYYLNLEWGTVSKNTQDAYNDQLCSVNKPLCLYKEGILIKEFVSISELSRFFNYKNGSTNHISKLADSQIVITRGRMSGYQIKFKNVL